ncbi:MAG: acetyl-CoA carboxylase biotin carboxyl carrier protein [Armatimonadetes bacterium]|nr:acetyl-CoA carboxylase biotin carboxyl carrier protein [Armatimonadota bacterium]
MDSLVDLAEVQRLIDIVERHGLEGLTVVDEETEISITVEPGPPAVDDSGAPPAAAAPVEYGAERAVEAPPQAGLYQLKSPITGVFYRSPAPGQPPFVEIGDAVDEGDVVCLIEAMKIFNEISAGIHGKLARVVAANDQLVVAGEVLLEFEPLGGGAK